MIPILQGFQQERAGLVELLCDEVNVGLLKKIVEIGVWRLSIGPIQLPSY